MFPDSLNSYHSETKDGVCCLITSTEKTVPQEFLENLEGMLPHNSPRVMNQ